MGGEGWGHMTQIYMHMSQLCLGRDNISERYTLGVTNIAHDYSLNTDN